MLRVGELTVMRGTFAGFVMVIVDVEEFWREREEFVSYEERIVTADFLIWFVLTLWIAKPRRRRRRSARVGEELGCEVGGLGRVVAGSPCDCDCEPQFMNSEKLALLFWE